MAATKNKQDKNSTKGSSRHSGIEKQESSQVNSKSKKVTDGKKARVKKKPSVFLDDSSEFNDEEDTVADYSIVENLKNFKIKKEVDETWKPNYNNMELSFITHAAGIHLFYSPTIQQSYKLKKEKTDQESQKDIQIYLEKALDQGFKNILESCKFKWEHVRNNYTKLEKESKKEIVRLVNKYKDTIIKSIFNLDFLENVLLFDEILTKGEHVINLRLRSLEAFVEAFYQPRKVTNSNDYLDLSSDDQNKNINFLCNLRLHNRIEKRRMKNYVDVWSDNRKTIKWYGKEIIVVYCTEKRKLRGEEVIYSDNKRWSYIVISKNLSSKLKIHQEKLGKFSKIKDLDVSAFEYHIFGCEAVKNPAAFIHNHMILDLIKAQEITWEQALEGQLPMVIKGAIMGARVVNSCYSKFMPHEYLYDKEYAELKYSDLFCEASNHKKNANLLLEKEVEITKKWLEWKLGKSESESIIKNCCNNDTAAVKSIWRLILESCEKWYPGVLGVTKEAG